MKKDLSISIGPMRLKNPVLVASGTFGYGEEFAEYYDLGLLGGVMMKGISMEPRQGNAPPRVYETPCGMLNAIGLQNVGLRRFIDEKLVFIRKYDTAAIANVLGNTVDEYVALSRAMDEAGVEGIELNVSCPNVKEGGIAFCADSLMLGRLVEDVRKVVKRASLIVKLSPNVSDITVPARACEDAGADALSLINTIPGMAIDINTRRPVLGNIIGGLSGPAIKPVAVRMVYQVARAVGIPIIGMGGIMTGSDAVEFILAGASAVAVGTANFVNPMAAPQVLQGIEEYMDQQGVSLLKELVGGVRP